MALVKKDVRRLLNKNVENWAALLIYNTVIARIAVGALQFRSVREKPSIKFIEIK